MNQILYYKKNNKNNTTNYIFFIIIFLVSICLIAIFLSYCIFSFYNMQNTIYSSEKLSDVVRIQALYSKNETNTNNLPIIGRIEIEKLNLSYPIFSTTTDELLKLGICKVSGPNINTVGNLCLAGHNYNNDMFFSKINTLSNFDIIKIYDNSNLCVEYYIYNMFEVSSKDTHILEQTNNRELTLITCNNLNKNRIILKAKER